MYLDPYQHIFSKLWQTTFRRSFNILLGNYRSIIMPSSQEILQHHLIHINLITLSMMNLSQVSISGCSSPISI
jgi:hypothetical protein